MKDLLSSNVGIFIYSAIWSIIGGIVILVVYSIRKKHRNKKLYQLNQDEMNEIEMEWYCAGWRDGWQLNKNVYKLKKKGEVK